MPDPRLFSQVARKDSDKDKIAKRAAGNPERIRELLDGLAHTRAPVKYGCAKVLRSLSAINPEALV